MRAVRAAGGSIRHGARRLVRRACVAVMVLGAMPAAAAAAAAAPQAATITSVAVLKSSWMAMTVAVTYAYPASADTLRLDLEWRRLNGRPLRFTAASAHLAPGSGQVALATSYHGMLPPPTPMMLHLAVAAPNGKVLMQRDCEMALVTATGKDAWAGDLMTKRAKTLTWRVRACR